VNRAALRSNNAPNRDSASAPARAVARTIGLIRVDQTMRIDIDPEPRKSARFAVDHGHSR